MPTPMLPQSHFPDVTHHNSAMFNLSSLQTFFSRRDWPINKYLLSIYTVPTTVAGAEETAGNKTD